MNQAYGTDLRAIIRETALEQFATSGVDGVSVAEICRVARIANGSFYNFYRNKDALLDDLLGEARRILREKLAAAQRGNTTPEADHRRDVTIIVEFARDHQELYRLALGPAPEGVRRASVVEEFVAQRTREIERNVRGGRFRKDLPPRLTAYALIGMMVSTVNWWVLHQAEMSAEDLIDHLTKLRTRMTNGSDLPSRRSAVVVRPRGR